MRSDKRRSEVPVVVISEGIGVRVVFIIKLEGGRLTLHHVVRAYRRHREREAEDYRR